uniref:DNA-directed RNA polymerase III subunit RPC9 n=1 Tax=Spongospora subterranea TaxID=70186 RepID=A0A0H5R6C3_9EUKA|eukprot:CRZ09698.1 hypothetical protein [Spongospora subterranea]
MEVLEKPAVLLTDAEVLIAIQQSQTIRKANPSLAMHFKLQSSDWVSGEVRRYMNGMPGSVQKPGHIKLFYQRLESSISKAFTVKELIQFVDLRPVTLVELHAMIDECEERFTEEEILVLLDIIATTLPDKPR